MPALIHTTTLEYPRSLWQLRQENPNVSFPADPTDEDLAPFDHAWVYPSPPPACDPRTERLEEADPCQSENGTWQQQWRIREATPEEVAGFDAMNRPQPDWGTFKSVALQSATLNDLLSRAFPLAPIACTALAPAMLRAESNGAADFAGAWSAIMAVTPLPPEELAGLKAMAQACNLPQGFVEALDPAPAAGMVRARDEFGRFIPDDPATPEDEAWVPAE